MAGIDDNVAVIGDWVPPSPSPRTFFTSMLNGDLGSRPILEPLGENRNEGLFSGSQKPLFSGNCVETDVPRTGVSCGQYTEVSGFSEIKSNPRGGLLDRLAARTGFNAPRLNTENIKPADLSVKPDSISPYLTIPPGLSPTTLLLDSPVFLSNSLVQPSPTTGKFILGLSADDRSSTLISEVTDRAKDPFSEDINNSSFVFKPVAESGSWFSLVAANKLNAANIAQHSYPSIQVSVQPENFLRTQLTEATKVLSQDTKQSFVRMDFSLSSNEKDGGSNAATLGPNGFDSVGGIRDHSSPLDEQQDDQQDEDGDQRGSGDPMVGSAGGAPSEDGYNWRKYGQKQVKGSEFPRSYYKCTHPNCQVKKKVERSHEGHITEIIYKGAHNHPKPPPARRSTIGSTNPDMPLDFSEQSGGQVGTDGESVWASSEKGAAGGTEWKHENVEVTSSTSMGPEYCNPSASLQPQNGSHFESGDAVDASSTFSNDEDEDDRATHGSVSLGYDGEGDESESKRRKIEAYAEMNGAIRGIREPRVVVQTTSEVDILDDGYRWRKYGQKVVKGNPNPRSYYKCTSAGCTVRKHVERASHDLKSVITTYEGKHNHDVPAARNSSHASSATNTAISSQAVTSTIQDNVHRPEPSQMHSSMARFERPQSINPFGLARPQLGAPHGFTFAMNRPGLANLPMAGLGPGQPKLPDMPIHPYLMQQPLLNEMGFMLPKGEPKLEPLSDPGLNMSNGSSIYQQLMNRLPLGPQM
ncbi:WRKY domain [Dillenia turbinata]|uniref:WRKY domain n=1 Tax=Dillenia turbinata TaxID=194707 RepID=A0AAN8VRF2_9MAGN